MSTCSPHPEGADGFISAERENPFINLVILLRGTVTRLGDGFQQAAVSCIVGSQVAVIRL